MDAPTKYELKESLCICDDIDRCVKNKLNDEQTEQVLKWNERIRFFNDMEVENNETLRNNRKLSEFN